MRERQRSTWNSELERDWQRTERKFKEVDQKIKNYLRLRYLVLIGLALLATPIAVLSVLIFQNHDRTNLSTSEPESQTENVAPGDSLSDPFSEIPPGFWEEFSNQIPKEQCGDTVMPEDYPLSSYPVSVSYSRDTLEIITSQYCRNAKKEGNTIQIASFDNQRDAEEFRDSLQEEVEGIKVGKPVWIDETRNPVSFPREECGSEAPSSSRSPTNYYPVYINYSEQNLSRVRSDFCEDAHKQARPSGKVSVKVASFNSGEAAEKFKEFIVAHINVAGEVGEPTLRGGGSECDATLKPKDEFSGEYVIRFTPKNGRLHEIRLTMQGSTGTMIVSYPEAEAEDEYRVKQTAQHRSCSFGSEIVGSNPVVLNTNEPADYDPDTLRIEWKSDDRREFIDACDQRGCVPIEKVEKLSD